MCLYETARDKVKGKARRGEREKHFDYECVYVALMHLYVLHDASIAQTYIRIKHKISSEEKEKLEKLQQQKTERNKTKTNGKIHNV